LRRHAMQQILCGATALFNQGTESNKKDGPQIVPWITRIVR